MAEATQPVYPTLTEDKQEAPPGQDEDESGKQDEPHEPGKAHVTIPVQERVVGPYPINAVCPKCHQGMTTMTTFKPGVFAWCLVVGLCFAGLFLGCCFIPLAVNRCKDVLHHCPYCRALVGRYPRAGRNARLLSYQ